MTDRLTSEDYKIIFARPFHEIDVDDLRGEYTAPGLQDWMVRNAQRRAQRAARAARKRHAR